MKIIFLSSPLTFTLKATEGEVWYNMPDCFKTISLSLREMCTQVFTGK